VNVAALSFRVSVPHARAGLALLLLAAALLVGLVGGGNGLTPQVAARALQASLPLRAGLSCVWFLLALPAARAALLAPEVVYLRSLPVSRAGLALGQACVLALPAVPLAALQAAHPAGLWLAPFAALAMLGGLALSLDAPLAGAALVVAGATHPALSVCAGALAPALVWRAFLLAPSIPRPERRAPRRLSLAGALLRVLARAHSEALLRAALLLALTAALEWLAARQQPAHLGAIAATGALAWTLLGLGPLATALEEVQTAERWSLLFAPQAVFVRAGLVLALPAALAGGALAAAPLGLQGALRGAVAGLPAIAAALVSARDLEVRGAGPGERVLRVALLLFFGCLLVWSWE
jgi:hypothetical protein